MESVHFDEPVPDICYKAVQWSEFNGYQSWSLCDRQPIRGWTSPAGNGQPAVALDWSAESICIISAVWLAVGENICQFHLTFFWQALSYPCVSFSVAELLGQVVEQPVSLAGFNLLVQTRPEAPKDREPGRARGWEREGKQVSVRAVEWDRAHHHSSI